jgi:predicted permease
MKDPVAPPAPARRLLAMAPPPDVRDEVLGDLQEVFERLLRQHGAWRARKWYWREALSFSSRFFAERLRDRWTPSLVRDLIGTRVSWLDLKLAARMLLKYPGLTLVGGAAMAVAIAVCTAGFEFAQDLGNDSLPLDQGDRIVSLQNWNAADHQADRRSAADFLSWRESLRSVQDLSAFITVERNLVGADGRAEPVRVAEISASAFRVARVPPFLGRPLVDGDEQAAAPAVAVIGFGVWRTRFGTDPATVGRSVRIGNRFHTIVGIMPDGFSFPTSHGFWIPLRLPESGAEQARLGSIRIFGRLAPGATIQEARAELASIGARAAADWPETHGRLRPQVMPYVASYLEPEMVRNLYAFQSFLLLVLIICCANVATLIFARTATRTTEIAVRSALGASRGRLVGQWFAEALGLAVLAAVAGVSVAAVALGRGMDVFWSLQPNGRVFWWHDGLRFTTLLYVGGLTLLCAVLAGVIPAIKGTARRVQTGLQELSGRGSSLRFAGAWTVVIVLQVAFSVAFLPTAIHEGRDAILASAGGDGFAAREFLSVRLEVDAESRPSLAATISGLARRLQEEPGVSRVTFADRLPGMDHPRRFVEVDEGPAGAVRVCTAAVDVDYFAVLEVPVASGRAFNAGDLSADRPVVVVNQSFVRNVLGGRNAIGRRVRIAAEGNAEPGPWQEIVGVVPDLGMDVLNPAEGAGVYRPLAPGQAHPVRVAVRLRQEPEAFAERLRAIALEMDPQVRVYDLIALDRIAGSQVSGYRLLAAAVGAVAAIALLLSTAGIYSLMSFIVAQRTREIGIRTALGANPRRIALAIFGRALAQISIGALTGLAIVVLADADSRQEPAVVGGVVVLMMTVGVLACGLPAARALRIDPTEALRDAG